MEVTERWDTALAPSVALEAVAQAFSARGAKVKRSGDRVEVRAGSNWKFRLLGNLLASGKTLPIGLDVTAASASQGSEIYAHAFDTFGFRITDQTFFGAKDSFENRLEDLLATAAAAVGATNRAEGTL